MHHLSRRNWIKTAGVGASFLAATQLDKLTPPLWADEAPSDSMPMQLYKSLSDEQRQKVCLPAITPNVSSSAIGGTSIPIIAFPVRSILSSRN